MRIIFMGTPDFAIPSLEIIHANHLLVAVITAPDKPAGRGHKLMQSPVKLWALEHQIPLMQPKNLKSRKFLKEIEALKPDLFVVVAFRMLPFELLSLPPKGSVNVHASLLPKFRGAAPIQRAIMAGETTTGVTVFKLESHIDTGQVADQKSIPIGPDQTGGEIHDILKLEGAQVLLKTLAEIQNNTIQYKSQDEAQVTHAPKIFRQDCKIDFEEPVRVIYNKIRALIPYPCAWFEYRNFIFKICEARCIEVEHEQEVGTLFVKENSLYLACKKGCIDVRSIQEEGKRVLCAADFINGARGRGFI